MFVINNNFCKGSCENGNRSIVKSVGTGSRQSFSTSANPYCDPSRLMGRRAPPPPNTVGSGSFSSSGYTGDYDYADIDNFEMTAAGNYTATNLCSIKMNKDKKDGDAERMFIKPS